MATSSEKAKRRSSTSTSSMSETSLKNREKSRAVTQPISPKQRERLKSYRYRENESDNIDARVKDIVNQTKRGNHIICGVNLREKDEEGNLYKTMPIKELQGTKALKEWERRQIKATGSVDRTRGIERPEEI